MSLLLSTVLLGALAVGQTPAVAELDLLDQNGAASIVVRATDLGGLFVDDTISLTVAAENDDPTVTSPIGAVKGIDRRVFGKSGSYCIGNVPP